MIQVAYYKALSGRMVRSVNINKHMTPLESYKGAKMKKTLIIGLLLSLMPLASYASPFSYKEQVELNCVHADGDIKLSTNFLMVIIQRETHISRGDRVQSNKFRAFVNINLEGVSIFKKLDLGVSGNTPLAKQEEFYVKSDEGVEILSANPVPGFVHIEISIPSSVDNSKVTLMMPIRSTSEGIKAAAALRIDKSFAKKSYTLKCVETRELAKIGQDYKAKFARF